MQWTQEQIDQMFALHEQGYSASQIAREICVTRNAVIGKLSREKIKRGIIAPPKLWNRTPAFLERIAAQGAKLSPEAMRHTTPKRKYTPSIAPPKVPAKGVGFVLKALPKPAPKPARTSTVGIIDATGCLWAIGHDPAVIGGHTFCNHPKRDGSHYCEEHARENVASYSRQLIRETIKGAIKAYKPRAA